MFDFTLLSFLCHIYFLSYFLCFPKNVCIGFYIYPISNFISSFILLLSPNLKVLRPKMIQDSFRLETKKEGGESYCNFQRGWKRKEVEDHTRSFWKEGALNLSIKPGILLTRCLFSDNNIIPNDPPPKKVKMFTGSSSLLSSPWSDCISNWTEGRESHVPSISAQNVYNRIQEGRNGRETRGFHLQNFETLSSIIIIIYSILKWISQLVVLTSKERTSKE